MTGARTLTASSSSSSAAHQHINITRSSVTPGTMSSLLQLTDPLRQHVVVFLPSAQCRSSSDHLALSATCRQLKTDIENVSAAAVHLMAMKHDAGPDFFVRIGLKASSNEHEHHLLNSAASAEAATQALSMSTSTSYRRILHHAHQTYVYSLTTKSEVYCLALHPDGTKLLVGGRGQGKSNVLNLFDLKTKRLLRSFGGSMNFESYRTGPALDIRRCFFVDDKIVSHTELDNNGHMTVWNMDGVKQLCVDVGTNDAGGAPSSVVIDNDFFCGGGNFTNVFDVHAGRASRSFDDLLDRAMLLPLKGELFLSFIKYDARQPMFHKNAGNIRVINSTTLEEISTVRGNKCYDVISSNDGLVVASAGSGMFDVFRLVNNELVNGGCFAGCSLAMNGPYETMLFLHKERLYVYIGVQPHGSPSSAHMAVHDVVSGDTVRRMFFPCYESGRVYVPFCMVATEQELIVGFITGFQHASFDLHKDHWNRGIDFTVKACVI